MIKPKRIGHATFETPDLERMIDYYTRTMGLVAAERDKNRVFLTTPLGVIAIELNKGKCERCTALSFEADRIPTSARWPASCQRKASRASYVTIYSWDGPRIDVQR